MTGNSDQPSSSYEDILSSVFDLMASSDQKPSSYDESLLIAFDCFTRKLDAYPKIFRSGFLDPRDKAAALALIASGQSLEQLEADYIALVGPNNETLIKERNLARTASRKQSLTSILHCLLGIPEHKDAVMQFLTQNLRYYAASSFGFLGGRQMTPVIGATGYHRSSSVFDDLLKKAQGTAISNLCRNSAGDVLSPGVLDQVLLLESDAHGFLMSAIANGDRAGIEGLMRSEVYLSHISREHTLNKVGQKISGHPEWNLRPRLGPMLLEKNNATFMAEVSRLIEADGSSMTDFRAVFWADASPVAMNNLVACAVKSQRSPDSSRNFLHLCAEEGVDLYPGFVEGRHGLGAALDAQQVDSQVRSQELIQGYLTLTKNAKSTSQFSPLLLAVPVDDLLGHSDSSAMLLERYRLTGDKTLLKLGDRKLNGMVLESDLGL